MKIVTAMRNLLSIVTILFRQSWLFRVVVLSGAVLIVFITVFGIFFSPVSANFAFSGSTCTKTLTVLPSLQKPATNKEFIIEQKGFIQIMGHPVLATELCMSPKVAPSQNTKTSISLRLFGNPLFSKTIRVLTPNYPKVITDLTSLRVVSITDPLALQLSAIDNTFDYVLMANNKQSVCKKEQSTQLLCDPAPLGLTHATMYDFALSRVFGQATVQTVSSAKIETITPIVVQNSSITDGSTRYDKPKTIVITTDKPIVSFKDIVLTQRGANEQIPLKISLKANTMTIDLQKELARGQEFLLSIGNIFAEDGGSLIKPFSLVFRTSKGPKISGANISNSGVSQNQNITIQFDQPINQSQNTGSEISLAVGGKPVALKTTQGEKTITIDPLESLPKCTKFTINAGQNIANPYGIAGESGWSFTARTTCFDVFSIGSSILGRQIMAYRYGSGANPLLFVGGVHGDEQNAKRLMDKWIAEIDANPEKVPINRTLVIIPLVNPDGYAKNQRVNARGINLNRNFPANNWKAAVKEPSGVILPEGGGLAALSEPESSALTSYVAALQPKFVMSYHSAGGVAVANDAGASRSIAELYAQKSGYGAKNGDTIGNFFDYDTTGAFEDWLNDKKGIGTVLVELYSKYDDEFSRNKNALWAVTQSVSF